MSPARAAELNILAKCEKRGQQQQRWQEPGKKYWVARRGGKIRAKGYGVRDKGFT